MNDVITIELADCPFSFEFTLEDGTRVIVNGCAGASFDKVY